MRATQPDKDMKVELWVVAQRRKGGTQSANMEALKQDPGPKQLRVRNSFDVLH